MNVHEIFGRDNEQSITILDFSGSRAWIVGLHYKLKSEMSGSN